MRHGLLLLALAAGCAPTAETRSFDGVYQARVTVEGGNRCGLSGQNLMRVEGGTARIETRSTEIRGLVRRDGDLGRMEVVTNLDILTRSAAGRIEDDRFRLVIETMTMRGGSPCRYLYEGTRLDPKQQEFPKFPPAGA